METVKRVIPNHKRGALPKDPASLQELIIDEKWSKFEGKDFLIHDNGVGAANRVLVFGTEEGLHHLGRSSQWFMDGTFSTAPKLFSQLYVIRAPLGESTVALSPDTKHVEKNPRPWFSHNLQRGKGYQALLWHDGCPCFPPMWTGERWHGLSSVYMSGRIRRPIGLLQHNICQWLLQKNSNSTSIG